MTTEKKGGLMHELWLCKNVLEIINQEIANRNLQRVKVIYLEIGQLLSIDKMAFVFNFNVVTQGTLAAKAKLKIIDIAGKALCQLCNLEVPVNQYYDPCPKCSNFLLSIIQGEELCVKSMEVE